MKWILLVSAVALVIRELRKHRKRDSIDQRLDEFNGL